MVNKKFKNKKGKLPVKKGARVKRSVVAQETTRERSQRERVVPGDFGEGEVDRDNA